MKKSFYPRTLPCPAILLAVIAFDSCQKAGSPLPAEDAPISFVLRPADETGIAFVNGIQERYETFFEFFPYIYNGGGVATGDLNQDGLPDLYFTGNEAPDRLYINLGGFTFKDITSTALPGGAKTGWHNGVTFVDINNDGRLDIYVCRGGWQDTEDMRRNLLYINRGDETFIESAARYGLDEPGYSMQSAFFDMDNDNDLDVYIISRPDSFNLPLSLMAARMSDPPEVNRDKLYRNDNGVFTEIGKQAGIVNYGYSLGLCVADINHDGYADIYVANDFATPDHLYINQGDGTFRDELQQAMNHISLFSMGTDIGDINNDGLEDIIVMEMRPEDYVRSKVSMPSMNTEAFYATVNAGMHKQYMHNMLHLNRGNGHFSEIAQLAGVAMTDWSWSCLFADLDMDGHRDLFVTNGIRRDFFDGDVQLRLSKYIEENRAKFKTPEDLFGEGFNGIVESYRPIRIANYMFRNEGDLHFKNISQASGFTAPGFSNGAVLADLDNDGDLDIVINNIDDPVFIYENTTRTANRWLRIKLQGPPHNSTGIGAKVEVCSGSLRQYAEHKTTRGYLSSQEPVLHFGIGTAEIIDSIIVTWPDKKKQALRAIQPNRLVEVAYADASLSTQQEEPQQALFAGITPAAIRPAFIHREDFVDEFRNQVLLPHRFSTAGPKMSTADINGDGTEDLYIGGAAGMPGALYLSDAQGWSLSRQPAFEADRAYEDMGSVFFDIDSDGDPDLFVVSGGSGHPDGHALYRDRLYVNHHGVFRRADFDGPAYNGSAVAAFDIDGDGDTDLFIGGFVMPEQYPACSKSYVLENDNGILRDKSHAWLAHTGQEPGMIYAAAAANIDDDPAPELILAGEWMPVTVLDYNGSSFENKTETYGLARTRGWWASLHCVDINQDGRMDIVAGNLGENYKFKVSGDYGFCVYADDFDRNGTNDIFLAKGKPDHLLPVRGKECSSQQMPDITQRFPTFQSFAEADLKAIIGRDLQSAVYRQADIFSSTVYLHQGSHFVPQRLPSEAQFSIIQAICACDINSDGRTDLLLAGNRFDSEVETTPSDASMGCLLIQTGTNSFTAMPPVRSGLYLNGDIKDMRCFSRGDELVVIAAENNGRLKAWRYRLAENRLSL